MPLYVKFESIIQDYYMVHVIVRTPWINACMKQLTYYILTYSHINSNFELYSFYGHSITITSTNSWTLYKCIHESVWIFYLSIVFKIFYLFI